MFALTRQQIGEALEEQKRVYSLYAVGYCAKDANSIPYVRFDGKLSARQRQEVLERFSIPLDPIESPAPGKPLPSTRPRRNQTQTTLGCDEDDTNGNDSDFVAGNDSDDEFEENIMSRVKKSKAKDRQTKGKGKARAIPARKRVFDGSAFDAENPKVMLISLKAGALGLNLTVANHVFLWVFVSLLCIFGC